MIPARLHRILVRGYDPGTDSQDWWRRFQELHPNWELTTWADPIDPDEFELGRLFDSCGSGAQLADLIRIEVLWRFGGVYVDSDVEPLQALTPLMTNEFFIGTEDGNLISSGVIGSVPGHPALRALMDRLLEYERLPSGWSPNRITGPLLYTRTFENRDDVLVLPREVFYPYNPFIGIDREAAWSKRHALCAHHWAVSWAQPDSSGAGGSSSRLDRGRRQLRNATRDRVLPFARRVAGQLRERNFTPHGALVSEGTLLIGTSDGFPAYSPADEMAVTPDLMMRGWHDDRSLLILDRLLRPGDWYLDLTAGIGLETIAAARRLRRWGRVIAAEPDSRLQSFLTRNVGLNALRNVMIVGLQGDELDSAVPLAAPIRLLKVDPAHSSESAVEFSNDLIERGSVDYVLVRLHRRDLGDRWAPTLEMIERWTNQAGETMSNVDRSGGLRPVTLEEITITESASHLLFDLTGIVSPERRPSTGGAGL